RAAVAAHVPVHDCVVAPCPADAWRGRVYAVRYFLTFLAAGAAVTAIALLYGRGGFDLVLGTTATIALGFVFATAAIAVLVNGVEKQRSRVVAPAEEPMKKGPGLHPGLCGVVETRSDQKSISPPSFEAHRQRRSDCTSHPQRQERRRERLL